MKKQLPRSASRRWGHTLPLYLHKCSSCIGPLFVVALTLSVLGCGPGNPLGRKAVSGKITLNAAPLKNGSIEFTPHDPNGVGSGSTIADGVYSIVTEKGLPVGKYTVRIFSAKPRTGGPDPSLPPGPSTTPVGVDLIPPSYNSNSNQVIEVTDEGPNEFNYDIVTRKR